MFIQVAPKSRALMLKSMLLSSGNEVRIAVCYQVMTVERVMAEAARNAEC